MSSQAQKFEIFKKALSGCPFWRYFGIFVCKCSQTWHLFPKNCPRKTYFKSQLGGEAGACVKAERNFKQIVNTQTW